MSYFTVVPVKMEKKNVFEDYGMLTIYCKSWRFQPTSHCYQAKNPYHCRMIISPNRLQQRRYNPQHFAVGFVLQRLMVISVVLHRQRFLETVKTAVSDIFRLIKQSSQRVEVDSFLEIPCGMARKSNKFSVYFDTGGNGSFKCACPQRGQEGVGILCQWPHCKKKKKMPAKSLINKKLKETAR